MKYPEGTRTEAIAGARAVSDSPFPPEDAPRLPHAAIASVLDAVTDTFIALDRQWRFTYLNRHALAQAGQTLGELLGRSIWEAFPELLGTLLEAHYRRAMKDQVP